MFSKRIFWRKILPKGASETENRRSSHISILSERTGLDTVAENIPAEFAWYDYEAWLERFKADFLKRWHEAKPSPSNGLKDFVILAKIGEGTFGRVHLIKHKESGKIFAVKTLPQDKIVRMKQVSHVIDEKRILYATRFPFLISLRFSTKDEYCLYLGLPFVVGGDFFSLLRRREKLPERDACFYAAQICMALEYLHNVNCVYRDLKPENILIDARGYLKLSDFGFSKRVENRTMTLCGTPEYLAPELLNMKPYGKSVDWWAFGVLIYEMVNGQSPFLRHDKNILAMYAKICMADYKRPPSMSEALTDLIDGLLVIDMSKRLGCYGQGCKHIQQHRFFKRINWCAMLYQQLDPPYVPKAQNASDLKYFRKEVNLQDTALPTFQGPRNYSHLFKDF